jgi:hypothetical protein
MAEDLLIQSIEERDMEYVDKRARGGALWIVGDLTLEPSIRQIESEHNIKFQFAPRGGRASRRRPAWWVRSADASRQNKERARTTSVDVDPEEELIAALTGRTRPSSGP